MKTQHTVSTFCDVTEVVRFGEGLFWTSRMSNFNGWGDFVADMSSEGATGHVAAVLAFAVENGIGGVA